MPMIFVQFFVLLASLSVAVISLPIGSGVQDQTPFQCDLTITSLLRHICEQELLAKSDNVSRCAHPVFPVVSIHSPKDSLTKRPKTKTLPDSANKLVKNMYVNVTWWTRNNKVQTHLGECGSSRFENYTKPIEVDENDPIEGLEFRMPFGLGLHVDLKTLSLTASIDTGNGTVVFTKSILDAIQQMLAKEELSTRWKRSLSTEKDEQENREGDFIQVPCDPDEKKSAGFVQVPCHQPGGMETERKESKDHEKMLALHAADQQGPNFCLVCLIFG